MTLGFIGQGWIGDSYSNNFEKRGFDLVRYGLEEKFQPNKEKIKHCDIVFIAVPTPTIAGNFDGSALVDALELIEPGTTVVIKSTVAPGFTATIQKQHSDIIILHSPEFLSVNTAQYDADFPERNIIGIPDEHQDETTYTDAAAKVMAVLPATSYNKICTSSEAELIKYGHNVSGVFQILFYNLLYELSEVQGCDWSVLKESFENDSFMAAKYASPQHKNGRGAGGGCFIKDFAAFIKSYETIVADDKAGIAALQALEKMNISLLQSTNKDLDELKKVYT